jgi:hypothetical protein
VAGAARPRSGQKPEAQQVPAGGGRRRPTVDVTYPRKSLRVTLGVVIPAEGLVTFS